jgi:rhodanese-related sulfurtransferase
MKRIWIAALVAGSLLPASLALACGKECDCKHDKTAAAAKPEVKPAWKTLSVAEVSSLAAKQQAALFDANTPEFREKNGIIPGARLLASSSSYDLKALPAQKNAKLVFYCASTRCTSSHTAAERAVGAGYTDVAVMPDGLLGWKAAGQKTTPIPKS